MPPTRSAAVALLGAAALGLSAPAASAGDTPVGNTPVGSVSPSTVQPGGTVHLTLHGCKAEKAGANAGAAFGPVKLHLKGSGTFVGRAQVSHGVQRGARYKVRFWCGGKEGTSATVAIATHPSKGTHGGEGGSIGGMGTATAASGAALLAVAAACGGYALRKRAKADP